MRRALAARVTRTLSRCCSASTYGRDRTKSSISRVTSVLGKGDSVVTSVAGVSTSGRTSGRSIGCGVGSNSAPPPFRSLLSKLRTSGRNNTTKTAARAGQAMAARSSAIARMYSTKAWDRSGRINTRAVISHGTGAGACQSTPLGSPRTRGVDQSKQRISSGSLGTGHAFVSHTSQGQGADALDGQLERHPKDSARDECRFAGSLGPVHDLDHSPLGERDGKTSVAGRTGLAYSCRRYTHLARRSTLSLVQRQA